MKTWGAVIVGGGIIGLSLAISLRRRGMSVLVVEKGEPGREASYAAAGMLADWTMEPASPLRSLALESARMYPEYAYELQDESGVDVDLRENGTLLFPGEDEGTESTVIAGDLAPSLGDRSRRAVMLKERSVDPRALVAAALKTAKHRGADVASGSAVSGLLLANGRVAGVATDKTQYAAAVVVNCAGAWAGLLGEEQFPLRPVKGQMLSVVGAPREILRYVIRAPEVYLVPRSDGRIIIGSTLEEAGYDKRTDADTILRLQQAAVRMIPALHEARILEDWAGLRPGTPDDLPILGATSIPGYYVAAGHYRNGILLAPATAQVMTQVIVGEKPEWDLKAFSAARFHNRKEKQRTA